MTQKIEVEQIAAEAYQIIAYLASEAGFYEYTSVQKALDYFSNVAAENVEESRESILPWHLY